MSTDLHTFAVETDTEIAALYRELYPLLDRVASYENSIKKYAGSPSVWGKGIWKGRLVYTMDLTEAEQVVADGLAALPADASDYSRWEIKNDGMRNSVGDVRRAVTGLAETRVKVAALRSRIADLNERYTGWSRFFLVTSSKGHIHSSMNCQTCRITTTFGWLPEMSGRTEADCVEEHGPALCSVCFPSAPVEWTLAEITKTAAAKAAA